MKKSSTVNRIVSNIKERAHHVLSRSLDSHITLAVTGLSGAGKSAFITSLLHQLIHYRDASLPFFKPTSEQRLLGVRRVPQQRLDWIRYPYETAVAGLSEQVPQWPAPTRGVSTVSLELLYRPAKQPLASLTDRAKLRVDIIDYPGEWLLDLPLLALDYNEWCQLNSHLMTGYAELPEFVLWRETIASIDLNAPVDELLLADLAKQYADLLHTLRGAGAYLLQPGRFLLPGEYEGTPLLQFFPYILLDSLQDKYKKNSWGYCLTKRFEAYKSQVVEKFYKEYFSKFDRQIVLVDPLTAMAAGHAQFQDLKQALLQVLGSFKYGQRSLLRRLFNPRIDKVVLAASKADHVLPAQQDQLSQLVRQMVITEDSPWGFADVQVETCAFAAIKASTVGNHEYQGVARTMLKATSLDERKPFLFYPGELPTSLPSSQIFEQHQFSFVPFAPPMVGKEGNIIPHIAMDRVLQFLLGDKLQ
ncbi:YcjX family protein [Corallincola platygyrae]|uniref:YcjX family protein n=1 Tax=Corallincola platygyrae TaxID=1193278 RepID=A0ABW4XUM0_9GAMM